tara:strand:+ start:572 stop:1420 length:849 start_codon:yes stop_codon:yes gene_type:complete
MATPGYAALYRVPGVAKTATMDKAPEENIGEEKAPTMGLNNPTVPNEVRTAGQPQMMFDPSRARYAGGGVAGLKEKEFSIGDDPGYRAYQEGGMIIPELQNVENEGMPLDLVSDSDSNEDTVDTIDEESIELPDLDVIESDYDNEKMNINVSTSMLTADDEIVLEKAIETFPELMDIIPKMLLAANEDIKEFSGEGEVDGPGTETSDSIPARLSDGEFVFTAKSVKQLGVDKLRKMMAKAENDYDKDMNIQDMNQMESSPMDIVPTDVMSAARGGLMKNPYK